LAGVDASQLIGSVCSPKADLTTSIW